MKPFVVWTFLGTVGCGANVANHARLGDEAVLKGQYQAAVREYLAAARGGGGPEVLGRLGYAALKAEDFDEAIDAYSQLGRKDRDRLAEAVGGLERVARLAERRAQRDAATNAVVAIRSIAPNRFLGSLVSASLTSTSKPTDLIGLIPAALAVAGRTATVDSLLLVYADAQRETVACEAAAAAYRSVLRRSASDALVSKARAGLVECSLLLGSQALIAKDGAAAERWFDIVSELDASPTQRWIAVIGMGDARALQGDAFGASMAYQAVTSGAGVSDSLREVAIEKLNKLGGTPPTESGDQ